MIDHTSDGFVTQQTKLFSSQIQNQIFLEKKIKLHLSPHKGFLNFLFVQLDGNSYSSRVDTMDMHQIFSFRASLLFGSLRSILNDSLRQKQYAEGKHLLRHLALKISLWNS